MKTGKEDTCPTCGGKVEKAVVDAEIENIIVKGVQALVCRGCGEKYYPTEVAEAIARTATFVKSTFEKIGSEAAT